MATGMKGSEHVQQTGISQMFEIDHIEVRDGATWVCLREDPQLTQDGHRVTVGERGRSRQRLIR